MKTTQVNEKLTFIVDRKKIFPLFDVTINILNTRNFESESFKKAEKSGKN